MGDVYSKETRSYVMSQIKGENTKPELLVRKFLFSQGFRYKLHDGTLPGRPDIVLPKYKTVIFINGCFWHGHQDCSKSTLPASNVEFWQKKILGTIARDKKVKLALNSLGWKIITIWECKLKNKEIANISMKSLAKRLMLLKKK